jgi:hypothetical protein
MSICISCKEECEEVTIKDGFYYDYGSISNAWHDESYDGSSCCGEPVVIGKIFFEKNSTHTARKEHKNSEGEVIIKPGDVYGLYLRKGYYVDDDGTHQAIYEYRKRVILSKEDAENGDWIFHKKGWQGSWECKKCSRRSYRKPNECPACKKAEEDAMSLIGEVQI